MHRSEPVLRASGSAGEQHTLSLPCYNGASTCQLRRRRDELESDNVRVAAAGAAGLRPPASKYDLTERRSSEEFSHRPMTECLVMDVGEAVERVSEGVSGYSIRVGDLANASQPSTFHVRQVSYATDECNGGSLEETPLPVKAPPAASGAAIEDTAPSTALQARCEVIRLADRNDSAAAGQENETTTSEDHSRLHSALQAQCFKSLSRDCTYSDIENQLSPAVSDGDLRDVKADEDEDISDTLTKKEWLDCISRMSNCSQEYCNDHRCQKGRHVVRAIEESLWKPGRWSPAKEQRQVLYALAEHGRMCQDVVMCRMPWCFYFFHCADLPYDKQIASLRRFYLSSDWDEWFHLCRNNYFLQFNESKEWPSIIGKHFDSPQPKFDFTIINKSFGRSGYINYMAYSLTIPPEYLRIVQYPTQEWTASMWERLKNLRGCEYIVDHQWVSYNSQVTTVCTTSPIHQVSLEDVLASGVPWKLPVVWQCASRLIKAAKALHENGILYLCWKPGGILLARSDDITSVQLSDFAFAVTRCQVENDCDVGSVMCMTLPAETIAPETSADEAECEVGEHCDVWGIGCLIYHMIIGLPVHNSFQHEPRDEIPNKIYESLASKLKAVARQCCLNGDSDDHVLQKVLVDKKDRISLSKLEDIVEQHISADNV